MHDWLNRVDGRARSEMIMRNGYPSQLGTQCYLVVEGDSDVKFFQNIISPDKCKIKGMKYDKHEGGKEAVISFIQSQNSKRKTMYLGVVDADFDNLDKTVTDVENVITLEYHDLEMLIVSKKPNMRRIYSEFGDCSLVEKFEKEHVCSFLDSVLSASYSIACLKYAAKNPKFHNKINMKNLPYFDFVSADFDVNIDVLINRVKNGLMAQEIRLEYDKVCQKNYDLLQISCGHDVTSILTTAFLDATSEGLGYGKNKYLKKDHVETLLRAVFDYSSLMTTVLLKRMNEWQNKTGFTILECDYVS